MEKTGIEAARNDSSKNDTQDRKLIEKKASDPKETERSARARTGSNNGDSEERPEHLLMVNYESQPERKRSEYRLEKFGGEIKKLTGLVRIVQGDGFYELLDEINSTADDPDHVTAYELDPVSAGNGEQTEQFSRIYDVQEERVEWAVESLLNRFESVRKSETEYKLATDYGRVDLRYQVDPNFSQGVQLSFWLTGGGPSAKALSQKLLNELRHMLPDPIE